MHNTIFEALHKRLGLDKRTGASVAKVKRDLAHRYMLGAGWEFVGLTGKAHRRYEKMVGGIRHIAMLASGVHSLSTDDHVNLRSAKRYVRLCEAGACKHSLYAEIAQTVMSR